jgi:transposase
MILSQEQWMELRAFKALADAGATWAEIARETGYDWRTVKRYLAIDAPATPPAPAKRGPGPRKTDPYTGLIDTWLRAQPKLKASVIWERLVAEHGFQGHYQRVKVYVRENRARLTQAEPEPVGFHRRFEVLAGAQAQVDWGDEGEIQTPTGPLSVSSFHMTLSYSRDPFCCYTAAQNLATFWDCHRRAFAHFGGVPAQIVYDRTKTVIRRHVGRGQATPLHPEAVAFASHYDFAIWLAAPYRAQTKGRVERQVEIVRSHVLDGRSFASLGELDAAFATWLPIRRAQVHRTHGEVIATRAEWDRAALGPLPEQPYVVCERHTRRVGKTPWSRLRPATTRCPGGGSAPAAGLSCASPRPRSRSGHSAASNSCWLPTPAPSNAAAGSSTNSIGTGWLTAPTPSRCRRAPATASSLPHPSRSLASSSCPGLPAGPRPRLLGPPSPAGAWPSTTRLRGWPRERADRYPHS